LDAQNAGNDISGIQISKIFWGSGILATHVAFSHCYPPLIYYLTERFNSFSKNALPRENP
jgi:hypothetical protein